MKLNYDHEVLRKAIKHYGKDSQIIMLFEEMSELQKEVCKETRGANNMMHIAEEIADVCIMLEQLKIIYDLCDYEVQNYIDEKTSRLNQRLEDDEI